jgi:transposase-like protein
VDETYYFNLITSDVTKSTLHGLIKEHVMPSNLVFTDDFPAYDGLSRTPHNYYHRRIRHSEKVYVAGEVHTQTIEGFWSLVKNGIKGVYHSVGRHYLQTYLNEYSFRYNRRFDEQPMFTSFLQTKARTLPFRWTSPTTGVLAFLSAVQARPFILWRPPLSAMWLCAGLKVFRNHSDSALLITIGLTHGTSTDFSGSRVQDVHLRHSAPACHAATYI